MNKVDKFLKLFEPLKIRIEPYDDGKLQWSNGTLTYTAKTNKFTYLINKCRKDTDADDIDYLINYKIYQVYPDGSKIAWNNDTQILNEAKAMCQKDFETRLQLDIDESPIF